MEKLIAALEDHSLINNSLLSFVLLVSVITASLLAVVSAFVA